MWWTKNEDETKKLATVISTAAGFVSSSGGSGGDPSSSNKKNRRRHLMGLSSQSFSNPNTPTNNSNQQQKQQQNPQYPGSNSNNKSNVVHVADTDSGIEVSFSDDTLSPRKIAAAAGETKSNASFRTPTNKTRTGFSSFSSSNRNRHSKNSNNNSTSTYTNGSSTAVHKESSSAAAAATTASPSTSMLIKKDPPGSIYELGPSPSNKISGITMSVREQLALTLKVYRAQYNVSTPVVDEKKATQLSHEEEKKEAFCDDFQIRRHRVPLFGQSIVAIDQSPPTFLSSSRPSSPTAAQTTIVSQQQQQSPSSLFDDVLFLLRSVDILDEFRCVEAELSKMGCEIEALEADRKDLQKRVIQLDAEQAEIESSYDVHRILARQQSNLTNSERFALQDRRGRSLRFSLHNDQARHNLINKCGCVAKKSMREDSIRPDNSRDGGAATTIQHVNLLRGGGHNESAFFMSRDKGKSVYSGRLPDRLFRRMKGSENHSASNILYLATGPLDCYFAEFRSGECWWGSVMEDEDFHAICSDHNWCVSRVAFGPSTMIEDERGHKHIATSWVVLGRDGRAAWKNVPLKLHRRLETRLASEAAPQEVALGANGAYFIRFLDGTIDYCLPAATARVLESLRREGAVIMTMSLNPEFSHDYIIRHR